MSKKPHPERVDPTMARAALAETAGEAAMESVRLAWTKYIVRHFRQTGKLAPGIDMRDLQEFFRREARP